jgi:threonine dehydratase
MKLVIEPSAAVGLAVVLQHAGRFAGKRVAIVLSGGNVDIDKLPW